MCPQQDQTATSDALPQGAVTWNKLDMALEAMFSERETWLARAHAAEKANDHELARLYRRQVERLATEAAFLLNGPAPKQESSVILFTSNRKGN